MTNIHRLVYYSRNRIRGDALALSSEIEQILATSRVNNEAVGISGALMFNAGCFAQVLEGAREALEDTFERIQQDARHGDVSLLAFNPSPHRVFDTWSMGFVGASVEDSARYGAVADASGFDPSRMTGEAILEALHRLALEEESV